jgi:hypothetical protein
MHFFSNLLPCLNGGSIIFPSCVFDTHVHVLPELVCLFGCISGTIKIIWTRTSRGILATSITIAQPKVNHDILFNEFGL